MKLLDKKWITILLFLVANTVCISGLQAQYKQLTPKEQKKILKKGDLAYKNLKYPVAMVYYENYLQTVANDPEVLPKLANCYWQMKEYDNTLRVYNLLFPNGKIGATIEQQLRISELFARKRDYKQASLWLSGIPGYELRVAAFNDELILKSMKKDSLNWHLGILGLNTSYQEFSPFLHNGILFFSSNKPDLHQKVFLDYTGTNFTSLWEVPIKKIVANLLEGMDMALSSNNEQIKAKTAETIKADILHGKGNSIFDKSYPDTAFNPYVTLVKGLSDIYYNVGTVSIDQNNHFYFATNYNKPDRDRVIRLHLVEGVYKPSGTMKMKELPFGDSKTYTVMHPAINRDGTLLVLSSDISGGKGGYDLYYAQRKSIKEHWSKMKAFSGNLNTVGNEVFPTIASNNDLYFSSDGLPGLGGLDIFRIPLQDALEGNGKPEHLSYPVNSPGDDFGWTQDSTALSGFFTSDRFNNNDIFSFYYKEPVKMYFIENQVINKESNMPLEGATLFLLNKKDGRVYIAKTDKQGNYHFEVPDAKDIIVKVIKKGFSSFCLPLKAVKIYQSNDSVGIASPNFSLDKLTINYAWKLNVLYYGFDKYNLSPGSKSVLDTLIGILKSYPISVEISSHTDSRGTVDYNNKLSQRRSQAVVNYLVQNGIDSTRLIAKGYGKSRLIRRCANGVPCSEQDHQANRRTEVRVIDYNVDQKSVLENVDPDKYKSGDVINKNALPLGFFNECDPSSTQSGNQATEPAIKE